MKTILKACLFAAFVANSAFAQTGGSQVPRQSAQQHAAQHAGRLKWRPWSDAVFADAKREKRFVLLDLEAVWCHWCYVMDANTYSNPAVIKLLESRYITVKADQDSVIRSAERPSGRCGRRDGLGYNLREAQSGLEVRRLQRT